MKIAEMIGCCDLNLKFMTKVLARLKGLSWERAQAFEQIKEDENTFSHKVKMCENEKHAPLKPSSCTFTLGIENIIMWILFFTCIQPLGMDKIYYYFNIFPWNHHVLMKCILKGK
jgi:hypothetical protein